MTYIVVDTENTLRNKGEESVGNFAASPFHPSNQIVYTGFKVEGANTVDILKYSLDGFDDAFNPAVTDDIIVGHNIGHDLQYFILRQSEKAARGMLDWLKKGRIWDTMIAEYILSGQQHKMWSLDKCSGKYGGTLKNDRIKQYWNDGVETEDIPDDELREYLEYDVENTETVFLRQLQEAVDMDMLPLIWDMMDARLATIMMEIDGMHFDRDAAHREICSLEISVMSVKGRVQQFILSFYPSDYFNEYQKLNISQKVLHPIFFGGDVEYFVKESGGVYKGGQKKGQPKLKKVSKTVTFDEFPIDITAGLTKGKNGMYSLDEKALRSINSKLIAGSKAQGFVEDLLTLRELEKDLQMLKSFDSLVWHDSKIHAQYNHAITETGRLSCANPNLQQVPREE